VLQQVQKDPTGDESSDVRPPGNATTSERRKELACALQHLRKKPNAGEQHCRDTEEDRDENDQD
jgi:hypothetical protein